MANPNDEAEALVRLTDAVTQLAALLADPHPELATWQDAVARLRHDISPASTRTRTGSLNYALGEIRRTTGRCYPVMEHELELLSPPAQGEFKRLIDDLDGEAHSRERRAAREPWRHMR